MIFDILWHLTFLSARSIYLGGPSLPKVLDQLNQNRNGDTDIMHKKVKVFLGDISFSFTQPKCQCCQSFSQLNLLWILLTFSKKNPQSVTIALFFLLSYQQRHLEAAFDIRGNTFISDVVFITRLSLPTTTLRTTSITTPSPPLRNAMLPRR